jgi:hypothetical protein
VPLRRTLIGDEEARTGRTGRLHGAWVTAGGNVADRGLCRTEGATRISPLRNRVG